MSKPKAGIHHAVDESGDSYRRMEKAGAELAWEPGRWDARIQGNPPEDLLLDADIVAIAGVANRTLLINQASLDSAPGLRLPHMVAANHGGGLAPAMTRSIWDTLHPSCPCSTRASTL